MSALVVACLTHVDPRPDVDAVTGRIRFDGLTAGPSLPELAALEHALRCAEAWGAEPWAVVAGPADADATLRMAAAAGARPLRVEWPGPGPDERLAGSVGDAGEVARALADAMRSVGQPSLVVCGDRSGVRGVGAVPAFLAEELGAVQALGLVALRPDGADLLGERRLDGGRRERLRIPRPAVVSVEGGVRLRKASLAAALAAGREAVPSVAPTGGREGAPAVRVGRPVPFRPRTTVVAPPAGGDDARLRLLALTAALSTREPPTLIGPLEAGPAADAVLAFLRQHGYLASVDAAEVQP